MREKRRTKGKKEEKKAHFCVIGINNITCIPIIAYMKNNIAISRQTYGSALKD